MAVTGPYIENGGSIQEGFRSQKVWYRQSKPYKNPLPFQNGRCDFVAGNPDSQYAAFTLYNPIAEDNEVIKWGKLEAKAYDRLMKKVGDRSQLMMNALELKSTLGMIATRASQLGRAVLSFKRGDIGGTLRELIPSEKQYLYRGRKTREIKETVTLKANRDSLASGWLELNFGWVPVISDIKTACDILSREFPSEKLVGGASSVELIFDPTPVPNAGHRYNFFAIQGVRKSGYLRITNPNLFLASQLGLVNPLAVAWDAVPFSFVVDWFLPVGKFLNSLSDQFGIRLDRAQTTRRLRGDGKAFSFVEDPLTKKITAVETDIYSNRVIRIVHQDGTFPAPRLLDRLHLPAPTVWLASTSLALVSQQLSTFQSTRGFTKGV